MTLTHLGAYYFAVINIITFYLYWDDKKRAKKGKWRTPENTLLLFALIGGSIGALAGMKVFHHKTRHWKFKILVPLFLVLHMAALYVFLG